MQKIRNSSVWMGLVAATMLIGAGCTSVGNTTSDALLGTGTSATGSTSSSSSLVEGAQAEAALKSGATTSSSADLQLTDDQRTQAQAIFDALRTDIQALRTSADDNIRALLTADQLATLDNDKFGLGLPPNDGGHFWVVPSIDDPSVAAARAASILANRLTLTADQQTAVTGILNDLYAAVQARREQARTDFRALLTDEQAAVLDSLKLEHDLVFFGFFGDLRGPRGFQKADGLVEQLNLTADQIAQGNAIFAQARTDIRTLRWDANAKIRATLTADQLKTLDNLEPFGLRRPDHGIRGRLHGRDGAILPGWEEKPGLLDGGIGGDRLAKALGLSDEQIASIKTILSDLRTATQAKYNEAQTAFRALLTDDQRATLDTLGS